MTLGIIDWGIGGLGLVQLLQAQGAAPRILYISDAGQPPYGLQSADALVARLSQLVAWLVDAGAGRVVIACNAASTVLDRLPSPVPIEGVIAPGVRAALETRGRVGVIGGARTIAEGSYGRALRGAGRSVVEGVAQPLSALVEAGTVAGPVAERAVAAAIDPLGPLDVLVLACTHYPALSAVIQKRYPHLTLVDPAARLAAELGEALPGALSVLTTGDPARLRCAAARAWSVQLPGVIGSLT